MFLFEKVIFKNCLKHAGDGSNNLHQLAFLYILFYVYFSLFK